MKRVLVTLCVLVLSACDEKTTPIAATQILLVVDAEEELGRQTAQFLAMVYMEHDSDWRESGRALLSARSTPQSFSIVPGSTTPLDATVEIVVQALDAEEHSLAELRRQVTFVPREERVLHVILSLCQVDGEAALCERERECHGNCQSCELGECLPTPFVEGKDLPVLGEPLDSAAPMDTSGEAGSEDSGASAREEDAGGSMDMDAGATDAASGMDAASDSGMPTTSALDSSSGADAFEGGPPRDGDNEDVPDARSEPCEAGQLRCAENQVQECEQGMWAAGPRCDNQTCSSGTCQGECEPDAGRCVGLFGALPEVCGDHGQWQDAGASASVPACEFACMQGRCLRACQGDAFLCSAVHDNQPLHCESNKLEAKAVCPDFCRVGVGCVRSVSCTDNLACGAGESCCKTRTVPGGRFVRSYDGDQYPDAKHVADVSPFLLDRFEVTVGRFRQWVAVYDQPGARPEPGAGKTRDPSDPGWLSSWGSQLAVNAAELRSFVMSCGALSSYTEAPGANEDLPINCVDWYSAAAFCIWDQGRLPTEAEWNFAAAGGGEQRVYPWTEPGTSPTIDATRAVFGDAVIAKVGSKSPAGDGRFGQSDLSGNVLEWVMDVFRPDFATTSCDDCVNLSGGTNRVVKGGAWGRTIDQLAVGYRDGLDPWSTLSEKGGFRCARDP